MNLLIVRLEWMQFYQGDEKLVRPIGAWGKTGNAINEAENFLVRNGKYYGNWRVGEAKGGEPRRLSLSKFHPVDGQAEGVMIAFVAKDPGHNENVLVGFYLNATVYQDRQQKPRDGGRYRAVAQAADGFWIPEAERTYRYPFRGKTNWYTYGDASNDSDVALLRYIEAFRVDGLVAGDSNKITEGRRRRLAERIERYQPSRIRDLKIKTIDDLRCEACDLSQSAHDHEALCSRFEVHHLETFAVLPDGAVRDVGPDDLAVLCACCHRAIHSKDGRPYVGDIAGFRLNILDMHRRVGQKQA